MGSLSLFHPQRLSLWLVVMFFSLKRSESVYPMVFEVDEDESRCFTFDIPEDNDASAIILPLPNEKQVDDHETVEAWYTQQVYKMLRQKTDDRPLPPKLMDAVPDNIEKLIGQFQRGVSKRLPIRVSLGVQGIDEANPNRRYNTAFRSRYFEPIVLSNIRRNHAGRMVETFENVRICMINESEEDHVHVVFVKITDDDDVGDHDAEGDNEEDGGKATEAEKARFEKEKHLSPLEITLNKSINAANAVLRDMRFMETREKRMRKTSESINSRIRWYAYFSVSILVAVAYIQVTYLKAYFTKKKVL